MRTDLCLLVTVAGTAFGGFAGMYAGEGLFALLDAFAPACFSAIHPSAIRFSQPGFNAPRKLAWGDLLFSTGVTGAACFGSVTLLVVWRRLGGALAVARVYLIVVAGGLAGTCLGGVGGYLIAAAAPDTYRRQFHAGGEPWFDPLQVGAGLGVWQGLLFGLAVGAVVAVALAWYRGRTLNPAAAVQRS